jgi:hypothetical protein
MSSRRKTKREKSLERGAAEHRCWTSFKQDVEAAQNYIDVFQILQQSPPPDAPGRKFYTNLDVFLKYSKVPAESNNEERYMYLNLIRRLGNSEHMTIESKSAIEALLLAAIASPRSW